MTRLIEIHIIQNHVPGNMNRDDMGAPKTCIFGGTQRLRISSQCLKRAARTSEAFKEALINEKLAERTRAFEHWLIERLKERTSRLQELGLSDDELTLLAKAIVGYIKGKQESAGNSGGDDTGDDAESESDESASDGKSDLRKQPLVFLGEHELDALIDAILERAETKSLKKAISQVNKKKQAAPTLPESISKALEPIILPCAPVALFGRMTTSTAFKPVDAAVCVAHGISTHKVALEVDYWTAMGDRHEERNDAGSDHIGERQYASATFYKYASVDLDQLLRNLGGSLDLAEKALRAFLKGLVMSYPSGMQTSMGHHNPPSAILIEQKAKKIPTNYANAFVTPLPISEKRDQIAASVAALEDYASKVGKSWGAPVSSEVWRIDGDIAIDAFIEAQIALAGLTKEPAHAA